MAPKPSKVKKLSKAERTLEGLDDISTTEQIPDAFKEIDSSDGELDDEFIGNVSDSDDENVGDFKGFGTAISTVLQRDAGAGSGRTAIMAEKRSALEEIQFRREESALKKQISHDKKEALKKKNIHVEVDVMKKPYEKTLKSLATRGVVQLFNAVMHHRRRKAAEDDSVDKVRKRGRPGSLLVKKENQTVEFKEESGTVDKKLKYYKNEHKTVKKERK